METCRYWHWRLLILLEIIVTIQTTNSAARTKEYDFEELSSHDETTPSVDIDYNTEDLVGTIGWECGKSSSISRSEISNSNKVSSHPSASHPQHDKRGIAATLTKPEPWIIGGNAVLRGEMPWMVAITKYQHKKFPRWRVVCGGVLLNQRYVLTAAHCIDGRYKDTLELVFNVDDATMIVNDTSVIRRKIEQFIIHPRFNSTTVDNDIALIEIKNPLEMSQLPMNLWPVCLPSEVHEYQNYTGTVSGWGYTSYNKGIQGKPSPHLLKAELPILSHDECLATKVVTKNNVTENMFCAGYTEGGKDSCLNDSGGPLTVEVGDRSYVVGLVSWGIGCGLEGYPGVYTKVSNYVPWIKGIINNPGS